jgi:trehalose 6-phosphate phosphatase
MTDYDGTLVPLASAPERAVPDEDLLPLLARLAQKPRCVLAVLSGRRLEDLALLLPVPGIYLAGVHGAAVLKPDGQTVSLLNRKEPSLTGTLRRLERLARETVAGRPGFLVENKSYALAIHFRNAAADEAEKVLAAFLQNGENLLSGAGLELLRGKKVVEVRPKGLHKGNAVKWLRHRFPGRTAVFLGDDTTDEDAFAEIESGFCVLVSEEPRQSRADLRLKSPAEVRLFLEALAALLPDDAPP